MFRPVRENLLKTPALTLITIPMLVLGTFGGYSLLHNLNVSNIMLFVAGYVTFVMAGIFVGFHHYLSHKSFATRTAIGRYIMVWAGSLACQGSPIYWVAIHRGYHHRNTDTLKDIHSPVHGFWHSFAGWIFKQNDQSIHIKYAIDLVRDKQIMWIHNNYIKTVLGFNIVLFTVFGLDALLYFSMLPCLLAFITVGLTNSVAHIQFGGYRNYETKDNSRNVPWLFPLVLGECWHNNHHGNPANYNKQYKWWEVDPAVIVIAFLRRL